MPPCSRSQFQTKLLRIQKKILVTFIKDPGSLRLMALATKTIDFFKHPLSAAGSSDSSQLELSEPGDVFGFMSGSLPSVSQVFDEPFFNLTLFALSIMYELAEVYGCDTVPD